MTQNKINKATASLNKVIKLTSDTRELIQVTKEALINARELLDQVKQLVDETDFPELKEINIPKFSLPMFNCDVKYQHIVYNSNGVNWNKLEVGLSKYLEIMSMFRTVNVADNETFQKKFNGFYKVRQRSPEFYSVIFHFLENNKNKDVSFQNVLSHLFKNLDRIEPSFSSKIAATINPNLPVWDSIVLNNLNLRKPGYNIPKKERLEKTIELYLNI